jgi:hypothetical protein
LCDGALDFFLELVSIVRLHSNGEHVLVHPGINVGLDFNSLELQLDEFKEKSFA